LTPEQLSLALKSVQYQNCEQSPGMKKNLGGPGGQRGNMRGGRGGNFANNGMSQRGGPMQPGRGRGF